MTVVSAILVALAALVVIMTALWLQQKRTGNAGTVDVAWSFGTGLAGVWLAIVPLAGDDSLEIRRWLVAAIAAVWAVRLGLYIHARARGHGEDPRYRAFRERHGERVQAKLFQIFMANAMFATVFAVPIMIAARNPSPAFNWSDAAGVLIWMAATFGEATADRQLAHFRADPANKGKVCDVGLWRYSRHPNYFFEWLHWFAYVAFAIPAPGITYHWMWLTLIGPLFMYVIVTRMTGIPPTEQHLVASRGDAYRAYQARTNAFFPGPVRER